MYLFVFVYLWRSMTQENQPFPTTTTGGRCRQIKPLMDGCAKQCWCCFLVLVCLFSKLVYKLYWVRRFAVFNAWMLRWNGRNVRMDMLPPLQEDPLRDAQRPLSLLHGSTLMQPASPGCTQKSWQSCQRGFRCAWQRLLNKEDAFSGVGRRGGAARNTVLPSGIMDQLSKQKPSAAPFEWFNVPDGGWKLTTAPKSA